MSEPNYTTVEGVYRAVRDAKTPADKQLVLSQIERHNNRNPAIVHMLLVRVAQQYGDDWETREL